MGYVVFDGILIKIDGDPSTDGAKEFELTDAFWDFWNDNKGRCKLHGFRIVKDESTDRWQGIYCPYALHGEGTQRLEREREIETELSDDEFYRSEGMITVDFQSRPEPYGTLASIQERMRELEPIGSSFWIV